MSTGTDEFGTPFDQTEFPMGTATPTSQIKRGDPACGRTLDEEHRPLVCFVCGKGVAISFNFCLEHKDEYERLKRDKEFYSLTKAGWKARAEKAEKELTYVREELRRTRAELDFQYEKTS